MVFNYVDLLYEIFVADNKTLLKPQKEILTICCPKVNLIRDEWYSIFQKLTFDLMPN